MLKLRLRRPVTGFDIKHHPASMFEAKRKGTQMAGARRTIDSPSAARTLEVGRALGESLRGGEIVLLTGSLGAGKSVFARGVAEALGVTRWRGSPTFALINEYSSAPRLIHVDLYRLAAEEAEELGLDEYATPTSVLVVEWADRALEYLESLPHTRMTQVHLEYLRGDERAVTIAEEHLQQARHAGC